MATACFAQTKKEETPKPAQSIEELQKQLEKILKDSHIRGMAHSQTGERREDFAR
jgi:hypothetical protein